MGKVSKYLAAVFALALFGALMAGCSSSQGSSGSASASGSSSAAAPTQEELIAELEGLSGPKDAKSVTMELAGSVSVDLGALMSTSESSGSAESASAEAASSASSASSDSSNAMEVPIEMKIKADTSGDKLKMSMDMNTMGIDMQIYINGDDVVIASQGQAYSLTLQELEAMGYGQYSSLENIMKSQGGDFSAYKDAVQSIEKTTEGGETVYTVTCDPEKIMSSAQANSTLSQMGGSVSFDTAKLVYRVDSAGQLTGFDMDFQGKAYSMVMKGKAYDYNTTVVDPAPEPTGKFSDIAGAAGANAASSGSSAASEEASAKAA